MKNQKVPQLGTNPNSPSRNQHQSQVSPLNQFGRNKHFWLDLFQKEQDKAEKKKKMSLKNNTANANNTFEDMMFGDGEREQEYGNNEKHPYLQYIIDNDLMSQRQFLKTADFINDQQMKNSVHKDKNILTDLPDNQNNILQSGVEFNLKKIYGHYKIPLQKAIHFISQTTVIYFVGNYIAVHNILSEETKYIGIDTQLQEIACFEVQTFKSQDKNVNKDSQTLIAYAEKSKEVYLKESKFNQKKIYGVSSSTQVKKRSSSLVDLNSNNATETINEKFQIKVHIFPLGNPQKKFTLVHLFDEWFEVQQLWLRDKESFCFVMCANQSGEQLFFIWNFRKEMVMAVGELKAKINKFMIMNRSESVLMLGDQYLKYYDANFTSKLMKENSMNIIPMKIEKENNFVDMDYLSKRDIFIIITDTNNIFIYEKNTLKFKLIDQMLDFFEQKPGEDGVDSVFSESLDLGDLSDQEILGGNGEDEENLVIQNMGQNKMHKMLKKDEVINIQSKGQPKKAHQQIREVDEEDSRHSDEGQEQEIQSKERLQFQRVLFIPKGFLVATSKGYFFQYEMQKDDLPPKLVYQVHLSHKLESFASMSLCKQIGENKNEEIIVAMQGIYERKPLQQLQFEQQQKEEKHMKSELFLVNLKAIQTQEMNKVVQRIFNKGVHDGSIYQITWANQKSQIFTLSHFNSLKIWTHTNKWNTTHNYTFNEQPLCISVHPSSWQIALGFKTGFKVYQNLDKGGLKVQFEKFGKACLTLAYNNGGNYLAAANASYIDIMDPIKMQVVTTLFGHKGLIRTILWSKNGKYMISTCSNGTIFFWDGNFKQQIVFGEKELLPLASLHDKSFVYVAIEYDDELDSMLALTKESILRVLINQGQECIFEIDFSSILPPHLKPHQIEPYSTSQTQLKVTCMTFSKHLSVIALGHNIGKVSIIQWPILPQQAPFKYEIYLESSSPITAIKFSPAHSKYLSVGTDDGNIYILESFHIQNGIEKSWVQEHSASDEVNLRKKRESYGMRGFSVVDSVFMCNRDQLERVRLKIEKLEMQIKTHEVNYKIKVQKKIKKFEKQKNVIEKEQSNELREQEKQINKKLNDFEDEKKELEVIRDTQMDEHDREKQQLIAEKETNISFVQNENDEIETKIIRLKETINDELEKIEKEHKDVTQQLISSYEQSIRMAQDEVKRTINKLKSNGQYYDGMIGDQEGTYEDEIQRLNTDLAQAQNNINKKRKGLEKVDKGIKAEYEYYDSQLKSKLAKKQKKQDDVRDLLNEVKFKDKNLERLEEKKVDSLAFINDKEEGIQNTREEKRQLENLIVFLSVKIKELKEERRPLEDKQKELETIIQDSYKELQDDYQFRTYLMLQEQNLAAQMENTFRDIEEKTQMKLQLGQGFHVFKREMQYLSEAKSLRGWNHKLQGMLDVMHKVLNAKSAKEIAEINMNFIHIAEIMESNARPFRLNQEEEEAFIKQQKLNEMELAYYRNKSSQKLTEMQFRFKNMFKQLEKQIKRLQIDNIKLIEEFNMLTNEQKKLNNLRKMIKESIREIMGEEFEEEMIYSSEDEKFKKHSKKIISKKKKNLQRSMSQTENMMMTIQSAREQPSGAGFMKRRQNGSQTQRDSTQMISVKAGGFTIKRQVVDVKKLMTNKVVVASLSQTKLPPQKKFLDKIVEEFDKNQQQIQNQTKNMEQLHNKIQSVLKNEDIVPHLNLTKVQLSDSKQPTITTRIPYTSERNNTSGGDSFMLNQSTNRKLPMIRE